MKRPAVVHLCASSAYGGAEEHLRVLLPGLARRGWRVVLACPPGSPLRARLAGQLVAFRDWGPFRAADLRAPAALRALVRDEPDPILHGHNPLEDMSVAWLRTVRPGTRAVTTIHDRVAMGADGRRRGDLNARLYRPVLRWGFDRILAVSEATRRDTAAFAGIAPHRIVAIANGTDFSRIDAAPARSAARSALGIPEGDFVFGMAARVETLAHRKKGVAEFLSAARGVLAEVPRARAWVAGLGPEALAQAERLLAGTPGRERITLVPFRADLPVLLSAWDVAVLPSLFEGLPRGVVEAMGMGKPVVATAVDGVVEALAGEAGIVVPPGDAAALAGAIGALARDPERARRMGRAGRERARRAYGAERMADDMDRAYRELLG